MASLDMVSRCLGCFVPDLTEPISPVPNPPPNKSSQKSVIGCGNKNAQMQTKGNMGGEDTTQRLKQGLFKEGGNTFNPRQQCNLPHTFPFLLVYQLPQENTQTYTKKK